LFPNNFFKKSINLVPLALSAGVSQTCWISNYLLERDRAKWNAVVSEFTFPINSERRYF